MTNRKIFRLILSILVIVTLLWWNSGLAPTRTAIAMPSDPKDETKVPHYFGPYPNWANSPFTIQDATVAISGDGQGAKATATVGGNGAITRINITNPGRGYT